MIIGKPANLFGLVGRATAAAAGSPVQKAVPTPVPLTTVLGDGRQLDVSRLLANVGKQKFSTAVWLPAAGAQESVISKRMREAGISDAKDQEYKPEAATQPQADSGKSAPMEERPKIVARSKDAFSWLTGTHTVVSVPQAATQDQVAHVLKDVLPAQQADSAAKATVQFVHSQAGHAVLVGIAVGGLVAALLVLLGQKKYLMLAPAAGVVAAFVALFSGHAPNPFIGKWTLNAIESHYQSGMAPREAVYDITEDGSRLKMSRVAIQEGGKREDASYHIYPDGKPHPFSDGGADSVTASQAGDTLTVSYSKNGAVVATETLALSADQKRLTVTRSGRSVAGQAFKDVSVYDRK